MVVRFADVCSNHTTFVATNSGSIANKTLPNVGDLDDDNKSSFSLGRHIITDRDRVQRFK